MSNKPKYKRVLVKISGESFCSAGEYCIEGTAIDEIVDEFRPVIDMRVQMALVVGGGNIIRGRDIAGAHVARTTADYMGMLATAINAIALRDALENAGISARAMSAFPMASVCEPFVRERAIRHLELGRVVIFAAGTGNPFFTTDTAAALRASEIDAELLVKATKVDGVFDSDPVINPHAKKYDELTYQKVLADQLGVMDLTAISLCQDNSLAIRVLQLFKSGNLARAICGEKIGTLVCD